MRGILTITLNPALDIATETPELIAGAKLRCTDSQESAGGGGVNISRAINFLGGHSKAFVALGGLIGQRLQEALRAEKVEVACFEYDANTRQNFSVTETNSHQQYRFVLPGPQWSSSVSDKALVAIDEALPEDGLAVLSGSFPAGVSADFVAELQKICRTKQSKLLVDTSGEVLSQLVDSPINLDILRMDKAESEILAGKSFNSHADAAVFAQSLVTLGVAKTVIVARGQDGSCLATQNERMHCICKVVDVVSAIGAGDSFVGGFTLALARGDNDEDALRFGTVSASAAVMSKATELCHKSVVDQLLPKSVLTVL